MQYIYIKYSCHIYMVHNKQSDRVQELHLFNWFSLGPSLQVFWYWKEQRCTSMEKDQEETSLDLHSHGRWNKIVFPHDTSSLYQMDYIILWKFTEYFGCYLIFFFQDDLSKIHHFTADSEMSRNTWVTRLALAR